MSKPFSVRLRDVRMFIICPPDWLGQEWHVDTSVKCPNNIWLYDISLHQNANRAIKQGTIRSRGTVVYAPEFDKYGIWVQKPANWDTLKDGNSPCTIWNPPPPRDKSFYGLSYLVRGNTPPPDVTITPPPPADPALLHIEVRINDLTSMLVTMREPDFNEWISSLWKKSIT